MQRSRPQSFAQKLRSTGKSVKGYINLSEGVITPSFGASPSGSNLDKCTDVTCKDSAHLTPRCWKTIYYLLDLYATRPETKTITHRFSIPAEAAEHYKSGRKYEILNETKDIDIEKGLNAENSSTPVPPSRELSECVLKFFQISEYLLWKNMENVEFLRISSKIKYLQELRNYYRILLGVREFFKKFI